MAYPGYTCLKRRKDLILSPRERDTVIAVASNATLSEAAAMIGISKYTLKWRLKRISLKCGVSTIHQIVGHCYSRGWIRAKI